MNYEIYLAPSGQWSWAIRDDDGEDVVRGAGYESEDEALEAALEVMHTYGGPGEEPPMMG